jgi:hypothetical protein
MVAIDKKEHNTSIYYILTKKSYQSLKRSLDMWVLHLVIGSIKKDEQSHAIRNAVKTHTQHCLVLSVTNFFFLKYANDSRIIILKRNIEPNIQHASNQRQQKKNQQARS